MNSLIGNLQKLSGDLASPVNYTLPLGEHKIFLNPLLGKKISLRFLGEIHCIRCGRKTAKSFQQGHCFPCHRKLLECNCHVQPEKCRFYEGVCNAEHWAHAHCGQAHFIYFANSSALKVGITRESHIPSRWI